MQGAECACVYLFSAICYLMTQAVQKVCLDLIFAKSDPSEGETSLIHSVNCKGFVGKLN